MEHSKKRAPGIHSHIICDMIILHCGLVGPPYSFDWFGKATTTASDSNVNELDNARRFMSHKVT